MKPDVFISYSSGDAAVANQVCSRLEAASVPCWIAPRDIVAGSSWSASIITGLNRCRMLVLIYSERSNVSVQVQREVERAVDKGLPLLPFRIEDVPFTPEMEYYLSTSHWLNALTDPLEPHLERLAEAVVTLLAKLPLTRNLPQSLTTFIGREKQIEEIQAVLTSTRLLTLTGSGGCGKTRLALKVGEVLAREYEDGVWLAELGALSEPSLVASRVLQALNLREEPKRTILETLTEHLKSKRLLLMLDNCEHLVEACAALADSLLSTCPDLTILATSREGLNVGGEHRYRVPPLSLPDLKGATPESVNRSESVLLFTERACQSRSEFAVTAQNALPLAQVCHQLDGIPLALELAAARVRSLSVEEINSRLDHRFRLLTGGSRTALPRQQTLRALIDWSYDLLTDQEKTLLRRLSVFAGGWTLAAAEKVCSREGIEEWETLDLLTGLVDKSLVLAVEADGSVRYRMLETVREYAGEKLTQSGEEEALRDQHMEWYLALAEEAAPKLKGSEQVEWLERLETEHHDLRVALTWSLKTGAEGGGKVGESQVRAPGAPGIVPAALLFCGALQQFWWTRGLLAEGRAWCDTALAVEGAQERTAAWAKALSGVGVLAAMQGDYASARAYWEESLEIYRKIGGRSSIATLFGYVGNVADLQGDYASAWAHHEQSLAIFREIGDRHSIAASLGNLGIAALNRGDYTSARTFQEESLEIRREIGDRHGIASSLMNLGSVAFYLGDYASARSLREECLAIFREIGDRHGIAASLGNLGIVARNQGDYASAQAYFEESLTIQREIGNRNGIANSLMNLGIVAHSQGDYVSARAFYEKCLEIRREIGDRLGIAYSLDAFAALIVSKATAVTALVETAAVSEETGVEVRRAARLWGAAKALREQIGAPLSGTDQAELEQKVALVRARLGEADWTAAWEEGRMMTMEQAIAYALEGRE